jgi:FlaG/FlaF family flagellin (archaellin)
MGGLSMDNDSGISPIIGLILITFLVVVFSAAAYAVVAGYSLNEPVIANIEIMSVDVSNHQEVVLLHRGGDSFDVSDISILIKVNGNTLDNNLVDLPDVGGTPGFFGALGGVLWRSPANLSHDNVWEQGDTGDFKIADSNIVLNPGDRLTITIFHRPSGTIISSPERRV